MACWKIGSQRFETYPSSALLDVAVRLRGSLSSGSGRDGGGEKGDKILWKHDGGF
jgi:hypothetical protein